MRNLRPDLLLLPDVRQQADDAWEARLLRLDLLVRPRADPQVPRVRAQRRDEVRDLRVRVLRRVMRACFRKLLHVLPRQGRFHDQVQPVPDGVRLNDRWGVRQTPVQLLRPRLLRHALRAL